MKVGEVSRDGKVRETLNKLRQKGVCVNYACSNDVYDDF